MYESKIIGKLNPNSNQRNIVYDKESVCPTLQAAMGTGGGQMPYVTEKIEFTSSGCIDCDECVHRTFDCLCDISSNEEECTLITKIKIRQATKQGFIECEVPGVCDLNYADSTTRRGRVIEGGQVSPTLTTENIPDVLELGNPEFYNFLYEIDGSIYLIRIRKLIPLECGRLMGVDDESINKILEVNSNTQAYKQFGNSIVVDVLCAAFSQLGIKGVEKWNDKYKE